MIIFDILGGRLVAVGGTRAVDRPLKRIEIVRPPRLHSTPKVRRTFNVLIMANVILVFVT